MKIRPKVWSNLFYLIPLGFSLYYQIFIQSFLIFSSFIFSILFHINDEKKFVVFDYLFPFLLIFYNIYLCYLSEFKRPYFGIALFFVVVSLYFYFKTDKKTYELNHSLWHFFSAVITVFCILAYSL